MGDNGYGALDYIGPIKAGFNMGMQIQQNRQEQADRLRLAQIQQGRLEIERQAEERMRAQEEDLIRQREADRIRRDVVQKDSAGYVYDFNDALRAMGPNPDPSVAHATAIQRNPMAIQALEKDTFSPKPAPVVTPITFEPGVHVKIVDGHPIYDPQYRAENSFTPIQKQVTDTVNSELAAGTLDPQDAESRRAELMANGGRNPQSINKPTAAQKNVDDILASQERLGVFKTQEDKEKARVQLMQNGGRLPQLPPQTIEKLSDKTAVLELSDQVASDIDKFNAKFGPNSFDSYIGKFDAPYEKVLDVIRKRTDPEDKAALDVLTKFAGIRNRTLKTRSGGTVTAGEAERFKEEFGDVTDKNLAAKLNVFRNGLRQDLKTQIGAFDNRNVPKNLVDIISGPSGTAVVAGPLTKDKASEFLQKAGGDKEQARKLARDAGYTF